MSLLLENTQQRSHGRSYRRIGQIAMDLGGGCPTTTVDDVHDLAFAAAKMCGSGWHRVRYAARRFGSETRSYLYDNILSHAAFVNRRNLSPA
jgi:hypothetical protein